MRGLFRWLGVRIAAGHIISPDARVDPAEFPDSDYPVRCGHCGYLLRGLSADTCPECGTSFDRGRLLVEQYVLNQAGESLWKPLNRAAILAFAAGVLVIVFFAVAFPPLLQWLDPVARKYRWIDWVARWLKPMLITATLLVIIGGSVWTWLHIRGERKCRAIIARLRSSPLSR